MEPGFGKSSVLSGRLAQRQKMHLSQTRFVLMIHLYDMNFLKVLKHQQDISPFLEHVMHWFLPK